MPLWVVFEALLGVYVAEGEVMKRSMVPHGFRLCESLRECLSVAYAWVYVCVYSYTCWTPGIIRKHICNSPDGATAHRTFILGRGRDGGGQEMSICISKVAPVCRSSYLSRGHAHEIWVVMSSRK